MLLLAAGCGGDEETAGETETTPRTTVPGQDTAPPVTTETTPPPQTETAPQPQTQTTPPPETTPDSPENDQKPAPGTPESKFEEFCDQNPGACG